MTFLKHCLGCVHVWFNMVFPLFNTNIYFNMCSMFMAELRAISPNQSKILLLFLHTLFLNWRPCKSYWASCFPDHYTKHLL